MTEEQNYSEIQPYRDKEVRGVMNNLLNSSYADLLIGTVFPKVPIKLVKKNNYEG